MSRTQLSSFGLIAIMALAACPAYAATLAFGTSVELAGDPINFNLSVFPTKAGYGDGVVSGVFGDGTVLDYRFFNNEATVFNDAGYANGGAGLVSTATATNSSGLNGGALNWADVWTTNDPGTNFTGGDAANFTTDTLARSQGITGTVDISGLSEGDLYLIHGTFQNPSTVTLTMSGAGQPDVVASSTEDPAGVNKAYIASFDFADAAAYDTISWAYTNTDIDGSRARFLGVIVDGGAVVPEPSTFLLAALGLLALLGFTRRRRK